MIKSIELLLILSFEIRQFIDRLVFCKNRTTQIKFSFSPKVIHLRIFLCIRFVIENYDSPHEVLKHSCYNLKVIKKHNDRRSLIPFFNNSFTHDSGG